MAPKVSRSKCNDGYKLPHKIPPGTTLTTITKQEFRIGKSIGSGGFGEIYLCSDDVSRPVGDDATYVVKIEPHTNGPLFVEMNFYIRAGKPEAIDEFKKMKGLSSLGMPSYCGSGSLLLKGEKFRFLIMERFGNDLQKIFQSGKKLFSGRVCYNLALKVIDVLEYIHSKGYVHNDIKAHNLLLGYGRAKENDVYLVDFGLVSKYHREGVHYESTPDARKAHDGTIEYTSRDAHTGAHSRRSDLEILGYNLVHWMSGYLPWMDSLSNFDYVEAQKKGFMNDIKAFLQRCFGKYDYPEVLLEYFTYTNSLEFDGAPDYDRCRAMFRDALIASNHPLDGKIDFTAPKTPQKKQKKRKRQVSAVDEVDAKKSTQRSANHITPSASPSPEINELGGALTRSSESSEDMDNWCWERVLCSDPEMLIRQASRHSETDDDNPLAMQHRALEEKKQAESLRNPTPAMLEIMKKIEEREKERENMTWQQQLQHLTGRKLNPRVNSWDLTPNPLTPAMEEVIRMRSNRISVEIDTPITPEPSDSEYSDDDDDTSSHEEYVPPSMSKKKPSPSSKPTLPSKRQLILLEISANPDPQRKEELLDTNPKTGKNKSNPVGKATGHRSRAASAGKRRGSVHHVVKVTTLPHSPDRIRNKSSPVKCSPETAQPPPAKKQKVSATGKISGQELSHNNYETSSGSTERAPRTKGRHLPRFANSPQRLSSIPVDICIETLGSDTAQKPVSVSDVKRRKKVQRKTPANVQPEVELEKQLAPKPARLTRSRDSARLQDWSWEKVLLTNPEKISKKKIKT